TPTNRRQRRPGHARSRSCSITTYGRPRPLAQWNQPVKGAQTLAHVPAKSLPGPGSGAASPRSALMRGGRRDAAGGALWGRRRRGGGLCAERRRSRGRRRRCDGGVLAALLALDPAQPVDVLLVLVVVLGEHVAAGAVGDEEDFLGARRVG